MVTHRKNNSTPPDAPYRLTNGFPSVRSELAKQSTKAVENRALSFSLDTVAQMNIEDVPFDIFAQYLSKQIKKSARLTERRKLKKQFVSKLKKFGFAEEADLLERCSANFSALVCGNGHSFRPIVDFRCHLPFCPDCWELKAVREMNRNLPKIIQSLKADPSLILAFCTLTIVSDRKRALRAGNRKIKDNFRALRRRDIWQNCVGGIGRIENTFSSKYGWHPHIHSLLLLKNYIPQNLLSDAWAGITGDSKIVDIRQVRDVAAGLVETIKYPFKPGDLRKLGKEQIQQMLNSKGDRLGLSFGLLFGLEIESDKPITDEYADFVEETKKLEIGDCCPICQSRLDLIDFTADSYANFLGSVPIRHRPLIC